MNKVIVNGVKITTPAKYLRFDKSDTTEVIYKEELEVLIVKYVEGTKSSELVHDWIELVTDEELSSMLVTNIENEEIIINGLKIIKLVSSDYLLSIIKVNLSQDVIQFTDRTCHIYVSSSTSNQDFITLLSSNPYIEVIDSSDFIINNVESLRLSYSRKFFNSNDRVFSPKSFFTAYIVDEVNVMYQIRDKVLGVLKSYDIEDVAKIEDRDEEVRSHELLHYQINNESQEYIRRFPSGVLSRFHEIKLPIQWKINTTSISKAMDIKNRYNNLELISDLTSLSIEDYSGNPFKVTIEWQELTSHIGDRGSIINEGSTYSQELQFQSIIHYFMGFNDREFKVIDRINLLVKYIDEKLGIVVEELTVIEEKKEYDPIVIGP